MQFFSFNTSVIKIKYDSEFLVIKRLISNADILTNPRSFYIL